MGQVDSEKQAYWRDIVRRQQESGQTVRGYCRDNNLSEPSFYSWRRELAGRGQPTSKPAAIGKRKKRDAARTSLAEAPAFIPLRLSAAGQNVVEIIHPRGHVVRIPACVERESLRQILGLLDEPQGA